jgi:hypothetical protein
MPKRIIDLKTTDWEKVEALMKTNNCTSLGQLVRKLCGLDTSNNPIKPPKPLQPVKLPKPPKKPKLSQLEKDRKKERKKRVAALADHVRQTIKAGLIYHRYRKTSDTADLIGCSFDELMVHLGLRRGEDHLDHICPLSQARNQTEINALQHYTNLQWLSPRENMKKSNKRTPEGEELCRQLLGREWID